MQCPLFKPYTEAQYARRELLCSILMLAAFAWLIALYFTGWRIGVLSAVAAVFAGAAFGCYRSRRTERGVWMLALFIGACVTGFWALAMVMQVLDAIAGRGGGTTWLSIDAALTTTIVAMTARASWTVVVQNRALPPAG